MEPLEKAFDNDNFEEFDKLLSTTYFKKSFSLSSCNKRKKLTDIFDDTSSLFEKMLLSNDDKSAKYISLVFKFYNLGSDEEFLLTKTSNKTTWMGLVAETRSDKILFSFLMFDWFHPETRKNKNFCLVLKAQQFFKNTKKLLIVRLIEIIRNSDNVSHREIAIKIIHQLIYEINQAESELEELKIKLKAVKNNRTDNLKAKKLNIKKENISENLDSFLEDEKLSCIKEAFKIEDQVDREQLLQVFIVFWVDERFEEYQKIKNYTMNESSTEAYNLIFLLKEKKTVMFERLFEEWIGRAEKTHGDNFQFMLKPQVRLLAKIAEMKNLHSAAEFIFQKYPFIGINSSIMTIFNDVQDFKILYVCQTKELKKLVRNNRMRIQFLHCTFCFLLQHDQLMSKNTEKIDIEKLEKYFQNKKHDNQLLKTFLFGRMTETVDCSDSLFETILSTPGNSNLIELIWDKFDLSKTEEILSIVSYFCTTFCCIKLGSF